VGLRNPKTQKFNIARYCVGFSPTLSLGNPFKSSDLSGFFIAKNMGSTCLFPYSRKGSIEGQTKKTLDREQRQTDPGPMADRVTFDGILI
jgi:hypothetical protein